MSLMEIVGFLSAGLIFTAVVLLLILWNRKAAVDLSPLQARLDSIERGQERGEREWRDEFARSRDESVKQSSVLRQEMGATLKGLTDSVLRQIADLTQLQQTQMDGFGDRLGKLT
jgi:hypothetical protein